jgi:transcriptional regulator NrdR family protein
MFCPVCATAKIRVLQTRKEGAEATIRQRICRECGHEWFTLEVDLPPGSVSWHGGTLARKEGYKHHKFF